MLVGVVPDPLECLEDALFAATSGAGGVEQLLNEAE